MKQDHVPRNIVAIYCRLSDEDLKKKNKEDDSESIQNQKTMLINHSLKNGWEIYDIYSDDDFSGADEAIERPEFSRLMKDAEAGKVNIVLAKSQSRFTRDMEYVENILHKKFPLWGIRFVSIVDSADTDVKGNKKSRQINGLVNEWYVEDLSENIKAVFEVKKKQGKFVGAFAPYGYLKDPKDKNHFIIDEPAAKVVRLIFKLYLEGYGLTRIAQKLNDLGYPCPAEYKRQQGLNYIPRQRGKQGRIWRSSSVNVILKNRDYIGDMVQGKSGTISYKNSAKIRKSKSEWVIVENTHEPIVDRQTFELVQELAKTRTRPEQTGKRHIFVGKLKCATCQSALIKHHGYGNKRYFICPMKKYDVCQIGVSVSYKLIEETVFTELKKLIHQYSSEQDLETLIQGETTISAQMEKSRATLQAVQVQLTDAQLALENLYMDKVKGVITEKQFISLNHGLSDREVKCKKQIKTLEKEIESYNLKIDLAQEKKKAIKKYMNMTQLNREIIEEFVDVIYVKNTKVRGEKEIIIQWNL
ncbi:recombinase family protein [Anaerovorax sp. IOR16]|uniref:recombinase family protein n=1 Tax=Anaerovorax sp. IOR16 TaxID=2773458 RepID=UPI0019D14A42|nr:recombinase family protein [Anaerovorax sp. IOR16]